MNSSPNNHPIEKMMKEGIMVSSGLYAADGNSEGAYEI